jgi:hypothetical protein
MDEYPILTDMSDDHVCPFIDNSLIGEFYQKIFKMQICSWLLIANSWFNLLGPSREFTLHYEWDITAHAFANQKSARFFVLAENIFYLSGHVTLGYLST